ncbi:hypothetical protein ANN_21939 [Periplaneta americana]|uniref:DUF4817 domain-containing protein n=1 Tax=Periplaneta americana TaxID=6978 RepID=A0ABQ8S7L9_PERAM|nr:hypothetical protein ANN_21939 [Periplaneta americana]
MEVEQEEDKYNKGNGSRTRERQQQEEDKYNKGNGSRTRERQNKKKTSTTRVMEVEQEEDKYNKDNGSRTRERQQQEEDKQNNGNKGRTNGNASHTRITRRIQGEREGKANKRNTRRTGEISSERWLHCYVTVFSTFYVNVKMQFTLNQRLFLVKQYWITNSITATQRVYQREFGVRNPPKRNTILGLVNKLETTGSLLPRMDNADSSTCIVNDAIDLRRLQKNTKGRRRYGLQSELDAVAESKRLHQAVNHLVEARS